MLSVLLGENPQFIHRGRALTEQPVPKTFRPAFHRNYWSAGRTSAKSRRRTLSRPTRKSALPKRLSFPAFRSRDWEEGREQRIESILSRGHASETWNAAFSVSQPVFEGGRLRSRLKLARAQWQESVLSYQQTVQNALGQVSNSLVGYQKYRDFRGQQELLADSDSTADPTDLSLVLYKQGGASYLQVLTSETNYFSTGAQPGASPAQRAFGASSALPGAGRRVAIISVIDLFPKEPYGRTSSLITIKPH